jgi:MSHA biogenesis protein MshL
MNNLIKFCLLLCALAGCAHEPAFAPSKGHIDSAPAGGPSVAAGEIPKPIKNTVFLPPPKPKAKEQTYSVVVSDVPVREILFALARESKMNVDIHPNVSGSVTINAVDQTLPAILERISKQVDLRYRVEGNVLAITPDIPTLRTYKINYVNMDRDTSSSIGVAAQIASAGAAATTSSGATSTSSGNSSLTTVSSKSKNNFWDSLADNVRIILKTTKSQTASAEERAFRAEAVRAAQEDRLKQVEAVSKAGAGAEKLFQEAFKTQQPANFDSKDEVIINPVAGTFTVMATERQHSFIQQYVDTVMAAVQRQVLIEATIVEVNLNDSYKFGIDWHLVAGDFKFDQLLSGAGSTNTSGDLNNNQFLIGYSSKNLKVALNALQTFGNARVLSSPKLMALNNQTAILKAVDNLVYFTVESQTSQATTGGTLNTATSTPHTIPVGVVMSVTPQISDIGGVTLIVRPTISSQLPSVSNKCQGVSDPLHDTSCIPEIRVREMESVLQVSSGQTVVLGGLMQDSVQKNDNAIPGLSQLPFLGKLFQSKNDTTTKSEIVIFLRPTVVSRASLDSEELKSFKQYLPDQLPVTANEPAN